MHVLGASAEVALAVDDAKGSGRAFRHSHEVQSAFDKGDIDLHASIVLRPLAESSLARRLVAAGIDRLFDIRIDGNTVQSDHLAGKPAPDTFLAAADALGVAPGRAAVFEDALSGVEAGRHGGFGYVVGVDRVGQAEALRQHGADIVVTDLEELLVRA